MPNADQLQNKTLIIGGGIIGLSTAIELAKSGVQVTLLEKNEVGRGCSYGNAGWLTPCFALPLPMPGLFFRSIGWLFNPNGPLYIQPSFSLDLQRWLLRFVSSMTMTKAIPATEFLVKLSMLSLEIYKNLAIEFPEEFSFQQKGLLMVAESGTGVKSVQQELDFVKRFGVSGAVLNPEEIKHLEPALIGKYLGAVYFENEAHVEPFQLIQVLKKKALKLGVDILEHHELTDFETHNDQIVSVHSNAKVFSAQNFILATGAWSKKLGKSLGLSIPILGGKGYSMLVPQGGQPLAHPVMVIDRKLAMSPYKNKIRIAGTLELVDQDFSLNRRRAQILLDGANTHLNIQQAQSLDQVEDLWYGLRPCTPDGLPMMGYSNRFKNLVIATGHQMLGVQAGAGSGLALANLILNKPNLIDLKLANPNRF